MVDLVARPIPIRQLAELNDVSITSIADGEIIVWDSGSSLYINQTLSEAGIAAVANVLLKDGSVALTGDLSAGTHKITNLGTPSSSGDAASKGYVDALVQGLDPKGSVRVATTTAGTLASSFENGDTIDGVVLATGNRILIKDQSTASENGIYVVAASGAPARAADFAAAATVAGAYCFVEEGTTNGDKGFVCTSNSGSDVVGTNNLAFTQFNGAGGVSVLDDLSDVTITSLANGQVLYVSGGVFVNGSLASAGIAAASHTHTASNITDFASEAQVNAALVVATSSINDLADVTITAAASGDFLRHNGTAWVDTPLVAADLPTMVGDSGSGGTKGAVAAPAAGDAAAKKYWFADGTWKAIPVMVGDSGSGGTAGLVPAPSAGDAAAGKFFKADGTYAVPSGSGGSSNWAANIAINTSFRAWGHNTSVSGLTLTDGSYTGPSCWYFLSSGASCGLAQGSGLGNSATSVVLTNNSGSSRRMGTAHPVEYYDCLPLRGKQLTFQIACKRSASGNVRVAVLEWTGTANAPTKDVVNDWTSSTFTTGNFFISTSYSVLGVSSATSVGTSATNVSVTVTVGSSANNLILVAWSDGTVADTGTIEFSEVQLVKGSSALTYDLTPYDIENIRCEYRCRLHFSDANQTDAELGWGHGASTTVAVCQVPFGYPMRVVPSLSYTASDWQVADSVGARQDVTALAISSTVSSRRIMFMTSTVASGLTVGRGMATVADTTSGRYLVFDAEIGV